VRISDCPSASSTTEPGPRRCAIWVLLHRLHQHIVNQLWLYHLVKHMWAKSTYVPHAPSHCCPKDTTATRAQSQQHAFAVTHCRRRARGLEPSRHRQLLALFLRLQIKQVLWFVSSELPSAALTGLLKTQVYKWASVQTVWIGACA